LKSDKLKLQTDRNHN